MTDAFYASLVHEYILGLVLTGLVTKKNRRKLCPSRKRLQNNPVLASLRVVFENQNKTTFQRKVTEVFE
jgi:hypothetical protein